MPRKVDKKKGYHPVWAADDYQPVLVTRKAPKAYWRRNPYPPGYGMKTAIVREED